MRFLITLLVVLFAALTGALLPLLIFFGWTAVVVICIALACAVIAWVIKIALTPLGLLVGVASELGSTRKRGSVLQAHWSSKIPKSTDPEFESYLRWANHEPPKEGDPHYRTDVLRHRLSIDEHLVGPSFRRHRKRG